MERVIIRERLMNGSRTETDCPFNGKETILDVYQFRITCFENCTYMYKYSCKVSIMHRSREVDGSYTSML